MTNNTTLPGQAESSRTFQNLMDDSSLAGKSFIHKSLENLGQYDPTKKPPVVPMEIVPHPEAPLFDHPDWKIILQNALSEVVSTNSISSEMREVIKQTGLVSLWFFLKYIAGQDGPFDLLNNSLHVEMCNFRQRLLYPGCRGAMLIFRGAYKSTICTEGASIWELLRDTDLTIRLTSSSEDKAFGFFDNVKSFFESQVCLNYYPTSHMPFGKRGKTWNNDRIVLPNRIKRQREPSLEYGGVGGKSAGRHYKLHVPDDPVEFSDLNSGQMSSTTMYQITKWLWANERTLLLNMYTSRMLFIGTRYAIDDVASTIIPKVCKFYGYPMDGARVNEHGNWIMYYRKAIEDGMLVFPESMTYEGLVDMAETDWWTFATQYLNDPQNTGMAEFSEYEIKEAHLEYVSSMDEWFVELPSYDTKQRRWPLSQCDVIQGADPAGTDRYLTAKTSRSATAILVTTPEKDYIFMEVKAGYVSILDVFDLLFNNITKYGQWIRQTCLEEQGPFKVLDPIIRKEERVRNTYLNLMPVTATGDKDATIRAVLQPELAKGKIYATPQCVAMIMEEVKAFPSGRRKDILDVLKILIKASIKPLSQEEVDEEDEYEERWRNRRRSVTGYG